MWVTSRSARDRHDVLGVFFFLDQARHYVEQQLIGHAVAWTPPAPDWRAWHCRHGPVTYRIEHHAIHDRREGLRLLAATRSWQLRCAHCGAAWIATAAEVLAGDDWLTCPQCHGWQVQCTREPATASMPPRDPCGDLGDRGLDPGRA